MIDRYKIKYLTLCRHCFHETNEYSILDVDEKIFNSVKEDTEFEAINTLYAWDAFREMFCPVCSSNNQMIYNLRLFEESFYNKNNLASCKGNKVGLYLNIKKNANELIRKSSISTNLQLINDKDKWILERMIKHIIETINSQRSKVYDSSILGTTQIMVLGVVDPNGVETQINRFFTAGITKEELILNIYNYSRKKKIYIEGILNLVNYAKKKIGDRKNQVDSICLRGAILDKLLIIDSYYTKDSSKIGCKYISITIKRNILALEIPKNIEPVDFYEMSKRKQYVVPPESDPYLYGAYYIYFLEEVDEMPF